MNDKATFLCTLTFGVMILSFIGICIAVWYYQRDDKSGGDNIMKYNGRTDTHINTKKINKQNE